MNRRSPGSRPDHDVAPLTTANALLQAGRSGRLDRRSLIARAATLGIAAPVIEVILHAVGGPIFGAALARQADTPTADSSAPTAGEFRRSTAALSPPGSPIANSRLVVATPNEPDTLHPWLTASATGFDLLDGVMDGLLRYDSEHKLQPALATGFELSDDGLTYTFALREGVTFHDGAPFTANDVVASWKMRVNRPFMDVSVLGWDKVETVQARDPLTVIFQTSEPYAPFLSTVATTYLCPFGALASGLDPFLTAFAQAPIGTGPMRLTDWRAGDRLLLDRFDDYWGTPPRLDGLDIHILPDVAAQLSGFEEGTYQLVAGGGALPVSQVDNALSIEQAIVVEYGTQSWQHLDLKQIGFLRETRVRQALDFATPRQRIIDELLGERAVPAFADQAPGSWAYNPSLEPRPYLPDQAAELLDQAGLRQGADGVRQRDGEPFTIEIWAIAGDTLAEQTVAMIAESWGALGILAIPRFGDASSLWGPMGYQFSDRMTAALYTWTNANDPDNMYYWHSSQIPLSPTAGGGNLPAFFYPYNFQEVIDALTAEAATTFDRATRRELYWQVQELLVREVPVIFLYWGRAYAVAAPDLGGFWPSSFTPLLWNVQDWYLAGPPTSDTLDESVAPNGTPIAAGP